MLILYSEALLHSTVFIKIHLLVLELACWSSFDFIAARQLSSCVGFLSLLSLSYVSLQKLSISIRFQDTVQKDFNFSVPCHAKKKKEMRQREKCYTQSEMNFHSSIKISQTCLGERDICVCAFICVSY